MRDIDLNSLQVTLGEPITVAEGVGHCWFPQITRFATGELLTSVSLVADAADLAVGAQDIYISDDKGRTWENRYTVAEAMTSVKIPRPNGDILMVPGNVYPDPPGQWRTFSCDYVLYRQGGKQIVIEDRGIRVQGVPRDVAAVPEERVYPGAVNHGACTFDGDAVEIGGRLLTTMHLRFDRDELLSTAVFASEDEGHTWTYLSTVAGPEAVPDSSGPCEPGLVQLETGELMCVMRLGWEGKGWPLARAYSADGGQTWSPVDRIPAFSVEPSLRRLTNGTLVITSGRPGLYMWLSTDPRGESWQQIDLLAHHNDWAPGPEYVMRSQEWLDSDTLLNQEQTTSYTELVEVESNELLMVYDRTPFGWNPVPRDSAERSRVFVLPISVKRT